ncbi:hypothetical protein [Nitratireductor sp. GCM10026969]|uniref:hypothetical protein n=1 Tax=Nitratireductor sp. GCM10026969 TaxID=3252645 RepID=UPI0036205CC2
MAAAGKRQADAGLVEQAIESARQLPDQPADCRVREHSGVIVGDRLDVALIKTDRALGRANARVIRCADWYDDIKQQDHEERG